MVSLQTLLQIPSFFSCEYWKSVFQNAIGCTLGSFLAIFFSYKLYSFSIKQNDRDKAKIVKAAEENQLKAYALMIKNAKELAMRQSAFLISFIYALKKHPNEFPMINSLSLGDIKRVCNTITVERSGLVYMKYFPVGNPAYDFTNILKIFDYLYAQFDQLPKYIKRAALNDSDRKVEFSNIFRDCIETAIRYFKKLEGSNETEKFKEIKNRFEEYRGELNNIEPVYSLYFKPLISLLKEIIKHEPSNDEIISLFHKTIRGKEAYEAIINGYVKFEGEITKVDEEITTQLKRLEICTLVILSSPYTTP